MTNFSDADRKDQGGPTPVPDAPVADDRHDTGDNPSDVATAQSGPPPSPADLYLSPHSDDVCFSLGALTQRRRAGTLLTIYSRSRYQADPPVTSMMSADEVTAMRLAEDAAFAAACGLVTEDMGLDDSEMRGRPPFALDDAEQVSTRLQPLLLEQIFRLADRHKMAERPWLFCPSAIGGHVDHVAIMAVVAGNIDRLLETYRVCFYEDLYYASNLLQRSIGLRCLARSLPQHTLYRRQWEIGSAQGNKLDLVRLYRSQFKTLPTAIDAYSPALYIETVPHEAVWTVHRRA